MDISVIGSGYVGSPIVAALLMSSIGDMFSEPCCIHSVNRSRLSDGRVVLSDVDLSALDKEWKLNHLIEIIAVLFYVVVFFTEESILRREYRGTRGYLVQKAR
jgi:tRNA A37 threonylcarbamoyladenosine dehydratase